MTDAVRSARGLVRLLRVAAGIEELSPCVRTAVAALAAVAGDPQLGECIADGRDAATMVGDDELTDLLDKVLEALAAAERGSRAPALAA